MTLVACLGDSHYDSTSRFEECVRLHDWIADDLDRRGVDLVIHTGDLFERKTTPEERNAVAAWLTRVAQRRPVVLVRGNHDPEGDLAIYRRLKTPFPILVEETCGVHVVAGVAVACVAWPRKAELLARVGVPLTHDEGSALATGALQAVFRAFEGELAAHAGPRILAAHASVGGSKTGPGQPLIGMDMEVSLADLALARGDFTVLGHIHLAQEWVWSGAPIVYTGSQRRTDYGEVEEKSYVLTRFDGERRPGWVTWERVALPATPMILLEDVWGAGDRDEDVYGWTGAAAEPPDFRGADVRFRYRVTSDQRVIAAAAARDVCATLRSQGAVLAKPEEVVIATPRAPERVVPAVAKAKTLPDQLGALWDARRPDLPPERRARLLARVTTLGPR